ncbi:hypothetical protein BKE38_04155 [Pseudoroseomonas deserti]|uniref:Uncharacterized protein n=1 Tax=Teichococcus deserti TaxID=1817963 RepID=A0A1V2H6H0_9PROT|nr:hypothetical protein [Pseudoroseomonas deserti]ONG57351.1 hypothetical protein BKE38_04155 [Pseudoroseomonas deserti]
MSRSAAFPPSGFTVLRRVAGLELRHSPPERAEGYALWAVHDPDRSADPWIFLNEADAVRFFELRLPTLRKP